MGSNLQKRLPSLTGMRFIAALFVFLAHIAIENLWDDPEVNESMTLTVNRLGWVGVGFFFILSGFVLTWSARPKDTVRAFWRRRLMKVYPNHLVTLVIGALLLLWTGQALNLGNTVPGALLIQSWFPSPNVFSSTNRPAWSLACEALFYLSFPLLHRLILRIPRNRLWAWTAGVLAAVVLVPVCVQLFVPDRPLAPWADIPLRHFYVVYNLPPVRMLDFTLGILLARLVRTGKWLPVRLSAAIPLLGVSLVVLMFVPAIYGMLAVTVVPLMMVIAAGAQADVNGTRSPFRGRVMIWLGEVSFAFYMVHDLVLHYGHRLIGAEKTWSTPGAIGISVLFAVASLFFAWLLYTLVERPAMTRWGRSSRPAKEPRPEPAEVRVPPVGDLIPPQAEREKTAVDR